MALSGLLPYGRIYFDIIASHAIDLQKSTCYNSGTYSGQFTPYFPHTVDVYFYNFNDSGSVHISGLSISDGHYAVLYSPDNYTISFTFANSSGALGFREWLSSVGSFDNVTSSSTTFRVFTAYYTSDGNVVSVLNLTTTGGSGGTNQAGGFSGFETDVNDGTLAFGKIFNISINTTIPFVNWTTPAPGAGGIEAVSEWLGVGGFTTSSAAIWQVGVDVMKNSSNTPEYANFFVENPPDVPVYSDLGGNLQQNPQNCNRWVECTLWVPATLGWAPNPGDKISLFLNYTNSAAHGTIGKFHIWDATQAKGWPTNGIPLNEYWQVHHAVDQSIGAVIVEDPVGAGDTTQPLPSYSSVTLQRLALNQQFNTSLGLSSAVLALLSLQYCISPQSGSSFVQEWMVPTQPQGDPYYPTGVGAFVPFAFNDTYSSQVTSQVC